MNRRNFLKASGLGLGLLTFPLSIRAKNPTRLTLADRRVLEAIQQGHSPDQYRITEVQVHPDIRRHMSLQEVAGIPIRDASWPSEAAAHGGYVNYYHVSYARLKDGQWAGKGCYLPLSKIPRWIRGEIN